MNYFQRWRKTSVANQATVVATVLIAFGTLCLAVAAVFQYLTAREQSKAAREQAGTAKEQAKVMQGQLNTMQDQANSMREQTNTMNRSLDLTNRAVTAGENQANASMSQANTSKVSARAAEQSARLAAQSLFVGERPYFKITVEITKIAVGENPTAKSTFENVGKTPAHHFSVKNAIVLAPRDDLPADMTERLDREFEKQRKSGALTGAEETFVAVGEPVYSVSVLPNAFTDFLMQGIDHKQITLHVYFVG